MSDVGEETNTQQQPRPKALPVVAENIPDKLKQLDQWVTWRYEFNESRGEWTKVPHRADDRGLASSTNPSTWSSFNGALQRYHRGGVDGIGFVVTAESKILGGDLDHCKGAQWALDIIQRMKSYSEFSPSGEGVRFFVEASLPGGEKGRKNGNIEIYSSGRYLTVTGRRLKNAPLTVEARQVEIDTLYAELFKKPETKKPNRNGNGTWHPTDDELLEKAFAAQNGEKIRHLFEGDISAYPTQSEADLALCSHFAFYTDQKQVDRLFRSSSLMRDKWDERHTSDGRTYGELTIEKAFENLTDHYKNSNGAVASPRTGQLRETEVTLGELLPDLTVIETEKLRLPQNLDSFKLPEGYVIRDRALYEAGDGGSQLSHHNPCFSH